MGVHWNFSRGGGTIEYLLKVLYGPIAKFVQVINTSFPICQELEGNKKWWNLTNGQSAIFLNVWYLDASKFITIVLKSKP